MKIQKPTITDFTSATHTHAGNSTGGTVAEANLTFTDITTNDVSITKHGFTPKAPNDTTKFLRGDATWAVPAGSASPLTTKGDIYGHSTVDARIPVGTNGQVLTADSTNSLGVSWQAASAVSLVSNEVPSGSINSSNTAFTLANTPLSGSLKVFLNGQRLTVTNDYTISGTSLTMVVAPTTGDTLLVDYNISSGTFATGSASWVSNEVPSGTVDGSNATFTLVSAPISGTLALYRDGQLMKGGGADYTLTTNSIAFTTAPASGSVLLAFYQSAASSAGNADTVDGFHASSNSETDGTLVANYGGWILINDTLSYSSADSPTFVIGTTKDLTGVIGVGMRIKLTQTTVKYFIVTAITSSTITVYGGTDYTLANAAITSPMFSYQKAPLGFPTSPLKWTVTTTSTGNDFQNSPTTGTWYNPGSLNIVIPIGSWIVDYEGSLGAYASGSQSYLAAFSTLSTANNSESDATWTGRVMIGCAAFTGEQMDTNIKRQQYKLFASKTTYYLNVKSGFNNTTSVGWNVHTLGFTTIIRAVCAYL